MLERLADPLLRTFGSLESLPPAWREVLDGLSDTLGKAEEDRARLTRSLERTTSELHELLVELDALRRARTAAESTNMVRGEILATISRTMRTPADALLGLTGLLRAGALLPTQRAYVDAVHGAGEALRGILNDVSDYSRLESGTLPLEPLAFDLRVMVEDMAASQSVQAEAKGLALRLAWRPDLPRRVTGDPGRIRQVLIALVRDGLSRIERGEIVVEVGPGRAGVPGGGVRFSVEDSGPPISPDLLPTLFQPFSRSDAGREGGLGLPIAHHLSRLMGGELEAHAVEGSGTCYTLTLPLPVTDAPKSVSASSGVELPSPSSPNASMIVVEADPDQRTSWILVAEAAGFLATGFADREEALEELSRRGAEGRAAALVMFSDHDAEGYDAVGRAILGDERLGRPALIMLPAVGNPGDVRRLREVGFCGYLVKPVAPADLREMLELLRRSPRGVWTGFFLTRHALAEARRGVEVPEAEIDERLGVLTTGS